MTICLSVSAMHAHTHTQCIHARVCNLPACYIICVPVVLRDARFMWGKQPLCVCVSGSMCFCVCVYMCVCFSCASCSASPLIPHSARPKHPCYIIIVSFTVVKPWDGSSNWKQVSGRQRSTKCLCAGVTFKYFSDSVFLLNCGQRGFEACTIAIKLPGCAIICWSGSFMLFPFFAIYIYIYIILQKWILILNMVQSFN